MAHLLCIETSTTLCSVAIFSDTKLISLVEENNGYTHAENLHPFINLALQNAFIKPEQLSAIVVGKGPGSYTGLRIGVSAAKGLAYSLNIPLISINSLFTMAIQANEVIGNKAGILCPMLDARRMEVYTAMYESSSLNELKATNAYIVSEESLTDFDSAQHYIFFGDGAIKCSEILNKLPSKEYIDQIFPSAKYMGTAALEAFYQNHFEDVAYFEPFYLKEFFTGTKP